LGFEWDQILAREEVRDRPTRPSFNGIEPEVHRMAGKGADTSTKIAPKSGRCESWTIKDWYEAKKSGDWDKMIQMFRDRINGRYLNFIKQMKEQPYSGFAVMALGCALLETLHQFYKGLESSNHAKWDGGRPMNNTNFYVLFLMESSFVFKDHFKDRSHAVTFYDHFRCGLIHQAETKGGSKIRRKKGALLFEPTNDGLIVYRETFVDLLEREIISYVEHLKANDVPSLRERFTQKMDYICHVQFEEPDN
jgi:hypothetical protein